MMKAGHAWSGFAAGIAAEYVATRTGILHLNFAGWFIGAALTAGGALLPDLDHPPSTIARALGPLTESLSRGLNRLSLVIYRATKTKYDQDRADGHRLFSHTWPFAALIGAMTALAALLNTWTLLVCIFVFLALATAGLMPAKWLKRQGWLGVPAVASVATAITYFDLPPPTQAWPWLAAMTALGSITHCWGDTLTKQGCPWLWPFRIRGKRWWMIRSPLPFETGHKVELKVITPMFIWLAVAECAVLVVWPAMLALP